LRQTTTASRIFGLATLSSASPLTVPCVNGPHVEEHYRENNRRALESGPSRGRHPRRRRTNFAIHEKMPRSRDGCGAALLATAVLRCVPRHFGHGERWSRGSLIHSAGKTVPQLPHAIPADMLAGPLPLPGVGLFGVFNQSRGPFVVKNVIRRVECGGGRAV
jgi:hypothetical protein